MADLEDAAAVAVGKVTELAARIEETRAALAQVARQLAEAQQQGAADAQAIAAKESTLRDAIGEHRDGIWEEFAVSRTACETLQRAVNEATAAWGGDLERATGATGLVDVHLGQMVPRLAEMSDRLSAGAHELGEGVAAATGELQETLTSTQALLAEQLTTDIEDFREAVTAHAGGLASYAQEATAAIEQAHESSEQHREEILSLVEQELAAVREHAGDVAVYGLHEARSTYAGGWEEITVAATTLEAALQRLAAAAAERQDRLAHAGTVLASELADATARVERASSAFQQELATLARYQLVDA